eukprot:s440_g6.t1
MRLLASSATTARSLSRTENGELRALSSSHLSAPLSSQSASSTATEKLLASLGRLLKVDVWQYKPQINRINHWEDGLPSNTPPASKGCLFDAKEGLGWCGDFCVAPGVEGAARSGAAMAEVLASFHGQKDFCGDGLLPMDVDWVSIHSFRVRRRGYWCIPWSSISLHTHRPRARNFLSRASAALCVPGRGREVTELV